MDEEVSIQKISHQPADKIILSPMTLMTSWWSRDTRYIGRLLEGLPLTEGDRIRANLFGARSQDYFRNTLREDKRKVVMVSKTDKGWEARVEVIEESELIRSLGKYPPVYDRNLYDVKLNDKGEILSYEQAEKQFVSE